MKIKLTLREILDKYNWDKFCDLKGWDYYIIKEGLASDDEEVELTLEEAIQIGVRANIE